MRVRSGAAVCLVTMMMVVWPGSVSAQAPSGSSAPGPSDPAAAQEWQSVIDLLSKANDDLNASDRGLATFITGNKLTPSGKAATSGLVTRIDAARTNLLSSLDAAKLLAGRPQSTAADAARFRTANLPALTEASAATQAANAATQNTAYVDHSEQDRAAAAQRAADAAAARQAAADAAAAAAAAADQQRKDAAAAAKAADDQRKAAADAKVRADVDQKSGIVFQALKDQGDVGKQVQAGLDALMMRNNLTSEARNSAIRLQKRLDANGAARLVAQNKLSNLGNVSATQAATLLASVTGDVNALGREVGSIQADQKALVGSRRTYIGGLVPPGSSIPTSADNSAASAPAPRSASEVVPICDFTFEPADGKPMQVAIDGGPLRPLPTHARLASGRHTLSLRRGPDSAERHELLLCGYVSTVPLEPIK